MTDLRTCSACGHVGYDVTTRIVERTTEATMRVAGASGQYEVPARFAVEPRCIDQDACRDRQDAK